MFPVDYNCNEVQVVDQTKTSGSCAVCHWIHTNEYICLSLEKTKTAIEQLMPTAFINPLDVKADRAKDNSKAITIDITAAMCPYPEVEDLA